MKKRFSFYY